MAKKHSVIWEFFSKDKDNKYAVCNERRVKMSRCSSCIKSFTTTNLLQHLSAKRAQIHKQYLKGKQEAKLLPRRLKKQERGRCDNFHQRQSRSELRHGILMTQELKESLGELVKILAIVYHPLSVTTEDVGFNRVLKALETRYNCPSGKYFTDCVILKNFNWMKEKVSKLISSDKPIVSLTTNILSCSSNDMPLLSLTAHWLDKSYTKTSAELHAQALEMAHNGEYIAERISSKLETLNILQECVHLVMSDNVSNMVKVMQEASLALSGSSFCC